MYVMGPWYRHPAGTEQLASFLKSWTQWERVPDCKWFLGNDPCPVRRMLFGPDQNHMSGRDNWVLVQKSVPWQCWNYSYRCIFRKPKLTNAYSWVPSKGTVFPLLCGCFCGLFVCGFFVFLPYSLLKWFIFCSVANSDPLFHKVSMMLSIKSP